MQRNNRSVKYLVLGMLWMLSLFGVSSFAADPSFSLLPASWATNLKLYCNYSFGIYLNPGVLSYNGFDATIKFNSGEAMITHSSVNPFFTDMATGFIANQNLYRVYGGSPWSASSLPVTAATFILRTTNYIWSTFLEFTTRTGGAITFDQNTTDDGAVINSSISSLDMLTWVTNGWYAFTALPCIVDNEAPSFVEIFPMGGNRYIATWATISFLTYDWRWITTVWLNSTQHYRYSGLTLIPSNYQPAPSTVDNQEWVNSGTIMVNISCPTCAWSWSTGLTATDMNIITRTGDSGKNRYTWDSEDRWYNVSFPAPYPYEIERLVTVSMQATDNPNENLITHTGSHTFSFNAPSNPIIQRIEPSSSTNIDPNIAPIIFHFEDDRAWVDPDTISITIPQIMSGLDILYTWYTYSWSDLTLILNHWSAGTGNSGWYEVSFTWKRIFPSNTTIQITWSVYDYVWHQTTYNGNFTTRMTCADWWCADIFQLNILWWTFSWNYFFTWSLIMITWTNLSLPYPYFTWINNDILMCGLPYTWTILTWNIWIYDTIWTQINGTIFTWEKLYITGMDGLDFIYSGGVIIIQ